jgi:hypothetical protein
MRAVVLLKNKNKKEEEDENLCLFWSKSQFLVYNLYSRI